MSSIIQMLKVPMVEYKMMIVLHCQWVMHMNTEQFMFHS